MKKRIILETNATAGDLRPGDRFTYVVWCSSGDYLQHGIATRPGFARMDGDDFEVELKGLSEPVRIQNQGLPGYQF